MAHSNYDSGELNLAPALFRVWGPVVTFLAASLLRSEPMGGLPRADVYEPT